MSTGLSFNSQNPKRISNSSINSKSIRELGKKLRFTNSGARQKFEKSLGRVRSGGVTREEVHGEFQKLVSSGDITEKQARRMITEMGVDRKDLRNFKDISESREAEKGKFTENVKKQPEPVRNFVRQTPEVGVPESPAKNTASSPLKLAPEINRNISRHENNSSTPLKTKPSTVWDILNKKSH